MAHAVFFAVEAVMLPGGQVAAVAAGEVALLRADHVDAGMQPVRLPAADLAVAPLFADRAVEVVETMVHLDAPGMVVLPAALGRGGGVCAGRHGQAGGGDQ